MILTSNSTPKLRHGAPAHALPSHQLGLDSGVSIQSWASAGPSQAASPPRSTGGEATKKGFRRVMFRAGAGWWSGEGRGG